MYDPDHEQPVKPSKTRRKRDMEALQELGSELIEFSEEALVQLELPEGLLDAIRDARNIHSRSARRRQLQYIGKLMRDIDAGSILDHFQQLRLKSRAQARAHQELEHWRDRLIDEGDSAVEAFLALHAQADRQQLRQLVRQARKQRDLDQPPAASRALFRYLRELSVG